MKVNLGTIEVDDKTRKAIRKDLGKPGAATRDDVKNYLGAVIETAFKHAGSGLVKTMTGAEEEEGSLPEPTAGGSATANTTTSGGTTGSGTSGGDGTTPSTGNLGSAGTPGGTV